MGQVGRDSLGGSVESTAFLMRFGAHIGARGEADGDGVQFAAKLDRDPGSSRARGHGESSNKAKREKVGGKQGTRVRVDRSHVKTRVNQLVCYFTCYSTMFQIFGKVELARWAYQSREASFMVLPKLRRVCVTSRRGNTGSTSVHGSLLKSSLQGLETKEGLHEVTW